MAEIPVIPVSGQNEPLPFEQAPGRVVFVPYRATATAQAGAGVDYTFDLPQAATGLLRDTDLGYLCRLGDSAKNLSITGVLKLGQGA